MKKDKTIPIEQWEDDKKKLSLIETLPLEEVEKMVAAYGNESLWDVEKKLGEGQLSSESKIEKIASVVDKIIKAKKAQQEAKSTPLTPYQEMMKRKRGF